MLNFLIITTFLMSLMLKWSNFLPNNNFHFSNKVIFQHHNLLTKL
jgi:hypothetical protein